MRELLNFVFVSFIFSSVNAVEYGADSQIGNIVLTAIDDSEIFPNNIEVKFTHGDEETHLILFKDDELTSVFSSEVAEVAHFIPSGLVTEDNEHEFYVYSPGESDVVIVQRPSINDPPKFYGRYTKGTDRKIIHTHEDDHTKIYLTTENQGMKNRRRRKRSVDLADGVVEVVLYADQSLYLHVNNEVLPNTNRQAKIRYLKTIMELYIAEVDSIYHGYGTNETTDKVNLRVELLEYQIVFQKNHQPWVNSTITSNELTSSTVTAFSQFYDRMVNNFDFPEPDHLMQLTRENLNGGVQLLYANNICDSSRATSIVKVDYMTINMAKAIGYTSLFNDLECSKEWPILQTEEIQGIFILHNLNAVEDTSATDNLHYVMSSWEGPTDQKSNRGNRWRFSEDSATAMSAFISSAACLTTYDSLFDFTETTYYVGDTYSPDEQCQFRFGSTSYLCGVVDCYSDELLCYSDDDGACIANSFAQNTTCNQDIAGEFKCNFGFCALYGSTTSTTSSTTVSTTSTTDSSTSTTTSAAQTTTEDTGKGTTTDPVVISSTTTAPDCIVETGSVEFDLPGCGCCGGCGCDASCTECDPGLPSNTETEECTPSPDCCGSKVRVTTLFVPDGCNHNYIEGPKTVIIEKNGWENPETEVTAEVYQDRNDRWQVQLITDA